MLIKYKLGDVVKVRSERVDNPASCSYDKFVGLEHYVSGEIEIKKYGDTSLLKSAMKIFKAGDILVARRNVYLKRASIVKFDGITSGDSIVLQVENKLLRKIIPFVLNTDDFWEYAEKFSDGTMSKRLSPKVLLEYEFILPELDEQEKLAELLWAANNTKEAYKKLLNLTDELVRAQFIEMFKNNQKKPLSELAEVTMGQSPLSKYYNEIGEGLPFYQGKTEFGDIFINSPLKWCTEPTRLANKYDVLMSVRAPVGSVNIATEACCVGRGLAVLTPKEGKSTTFYLFYALKVMEGEIERMGVGSTFKAINKQQVFDILIPEAEIERQNIFVEFAKQTDKSKFELQKNINNLDKTIKALMSKNFG